MQQKNIISLFLPYLSYYTHGFVEFQAMDKQVYTYRFWFQDEILDKHLLLLSTADTYKDNEMIS
jgi:hypothetical protein